MAQANEFAVPFDGNGRSPTRQEFGIGATSPGATFPGVSSQWGAYFHISDGAKQTADGLHSEFLQFCRESGIEDIAKHSGLVHNGEISDVRTYSLPAPATAPSSLMPYEEGGVAPCGSPPQVGTPMPPDDPLKRKEPSTPPGPSSVSDASSPASSRKKRRTQSRGAKNKGLRHFSLKVCEKVQSKRVTTYNEVADELVAELQKLAAAGQAEGMGNNKNIRRRVYDALNVLMAMDIITKEKKEIRWVGLPTNSKQELLKLEEARLERIRKKTDHLEELATQQRSYANLLARNAKADPVQMDASSKIHLPFILVNTRNTTEIECEMAEDHSEYFFNFSAPFEIHDDTEVLKRAGMDREQGLAAVQTLVPGKLPAAPSLPRVAGK